MKQRFRRWELAGLAFTLAAGTALHFLYGWWPHPVTAAVAPVNESVWEHTKLLFTPLFLFSLLQLPWLRRCCPGLAAARAVSAGAGVGLIVVLYYTYSGILGYHILPADIAVFVISTCAAFALDGWLGRRWASAGFAARVLGIAALLAMAAIFVWFTFHPPALALFRDPLTGRFGPTGP